MYRVDKSFFQSNFFALLMKNFLKLKRNLVMLSFVFLLPAIQASRSSNVQYLLRMRKVRLSLVFLLPAIKASRVTSYYNCLKNLN